MDKSLLSRALADSEEPTPGYMYRDVVKWTFLDQSTQSKLIKALMDRLKPNATVHVLAKTLKMIRHLCENGHLDFQKEIQSKNETLKQFASFRGTQDAKYGDKLNERVRAAAKEAVDSAFAPRKAQTINIDSGSGSNTGLHDSKIAEKSGSGFSTGGNVGTNTSGKTGNAHIADMPTTNKWAEHMARGGGVVKEESSGFGGSVKNAYNTGFGLVKETIKSNEQRNSEKLHDTGEYQAVDIAPSFSGGGFGGGFDDSSKGGDKWKFTEESGAGGGAAPAAKEIRMITPLQKEVEKVGAFKNTPQRVEVSLFCESVARIINESEGAHSYDDLAEAMDASISQKHVWQVRLNVLCCIEGVARSKVSSEFNNYFLENPEDIQRNMHVVQGSLKERAQKVLKLLNIPERTAGAGTTVAQQISSCTNQGETTWANPVAPKEEVVMEGKGSAELDFGGMSETAPRRKKGGDKGGVGAKGDKTTLKKRSAMTSASDESTSGGWGEPTSGGNGGSVGGWSGGGGDGWGDAPAPNTTAPVSSAGGGWGDAPATGGVDSWSAPTQQQAPPAQAPPAQTKVDDMDAFFGSAPLNTTTTAPAQQPQQQQPVWGATAPATTQPVWGGPSQASAAPAPAQQRAQSTFDPMSLPAPAGQPTAQQQAPTGNAQNLAMQQQMMTALNTQMQQLMANAATNPNAQGQMQVLMQQQQQLIQMMQSGGAPSPAPQQAPVPTQQQQRQQQEAQQKKADDEFAFAAQQMRTQLKK